jgi:aminomethyltransferase
MTSDHEESALRRTPLHAQHRAAGAKLVPFGGWEMPLHYGSQIAEHHAVRRAAGMFDVSHMLAIDVVGRDAGALLRHALASDVARRAPVGGACYTCMLDDDAGIVDDVIVYTLGGEAFRVVVNAGTADSDLGWLRAIATARHAAVWIEPRRDLTLIAVQGPAARTLLTDACPDLGAAGAALGPFRYAFVRDWLLACTGYTGEDGFEIMIPAAFAQALWQALRDAGVRPCGLGARDTLRLEAGMNLYGQDMDRTTCPSECGLDWVVDRGEERDFVGRAALATRAPPQHRVGLVLLAAGVLRTGQTVHTASGRGVVTSGSFAPTLGRSIALARVPNAVEAGQTVAVEIRGRQLPARVVKPPFIRRGVDLIESLFASTSE